MKFNKAILTATAFVSVVALTFAEEDLIESPREPPGRSGAKLREAANDGDGRMLRSGEEEAEENEDRELYYGGGPVCNEIDYKGEIECDAETAGAAQCGKNQCRPGKWDFWRVVLQAGVKYSIRVERVNCGLDPFLALYRGEGGCPKDLGCFYSEQDTDDLTFVTQADDNARNACEGPWDDPLIVITPGRTATYTMAVGSYLSDFYACPYHGWDYNLIIDPPPLGEVGREYVECLRDMISVMDQAPHLETYQYAHDNASHKVQSAINSMVRKPNDWKVSVDRVAQAMKWIEQLKYGNNDEKHEADLTGEDGTDCAIEVAYGLKDTLGLDYYFLLHVVQPKITQAERLQDRKKWKKSARRSYQAVRHMLDELGNRYPCV